ncbi:MAG: 4-alpha-glucanotransferase [Micrococcales bacterium]|nr:4-alpha-glucanotransferase [Micrococcales bacterium]
MTAQPSETLVRLAHEYSISHEHVNHAGQRVHVSSETLVGVLAALGVDASTPEKVDRALALRTDERWRHTLPPVVVLTAGKTARLPVHVTHGDPVICWVDLEDETGGGRVDLIQADVATKPRKVDGRLVARASFDLPTDLPLGWHEIRATGPSAQARATLVVVPHHLDLPETVADTRAWGLMTQLYSVRSGRSWGLGDFSDLADLTEKAGRMGADFVLINPVHAAEPVVPVTPSPYLPVTRRFVNPMYIRVEDIRETAYLTSADLALVEWAGEPAKALNTDSGPLDRDAVWTAKRAALDVVFGVKRSAARQAEFDRYVADEGQGLSTFALWCALAEHFDGSDWPEQARDPSSPAVAELRGQLAERVEFYTWLQWIADEQLAAAQKTAVDAGMVLGIMHDLAVGVHIDGADVWSLGSVLASGATVGAPPDMYNQQGQDWSQPPWHPDELARASYRPYRDMLRTVLRHAGAVRLDHVLGLFRLWWIPSGHKPADGAYVRYDHDAMVGILMLEAQRAGVVLIGEDLGTVEGWVVEYLADRGILGTGVLWFENDQGRPRPPEQWRRLQLASVTTHDLPPTAGYLAGEHVALRERLGLLTESASVVRARAAAERDAVLRTLQQRGLISEGASERAIVEAMHRYILDTPSVLIGVSLADAVGERRAQNQPGTDGEYPNWKVPLADSSGALVPIEDLLSNPRLISLTHVMNGG